MRTGFRGQRLAAVACAAVLAAAAGASVPTLAGASLVAMAEPSSLTLPLGGPATSAATATTATAVSTAATTPAPTGTTVSVPGQIPTGVPVTLKLATGHVGWVSATVSGAPYAEVALGEDDRAGHLRLMTLTLPAGGRATVAHLLTDLCGLRTRTVTARAAGSATASRQVTTPACTDRLAVGLAQSATVARGATLTLGDRWRVGDLPYRVCLEPPGGEPRCQGGRVPAGHTQARVHLALPRIGGWQVTAQVTGGNPHRTIVWASHPGPIRLLAAGDSEMQVLDTDLAQDLAPDDVTVTSAAYPSTGLTVPGQVTWQSRARHLVAKVKPDISIVSMGANEGYGITRPAGAPVSCCGSAWTVGYGQLVAQMARTLLRGQAATAFWFELAAPRPADFARVLNAVNGGIRDAAASLPGRLGLIDANAYFTPGDRYRNTMIVDGVSFTIHESDGIHLDATADAYAARLVVTQLLAERVIR